jgi:D-alanyl-D-alanine carboxypeptidase
MAQAAGTGIKYCLIIYIVAQTFIHTSLAQKRYDSLNIKLHSIFMRDSLPGLSVILVDTGGITYQKNFGFSDIENNLPYNENTVQNIGSVSKTLISIALMKAVELKYFTLETDINTILPFKVVNPYNPQDIITVRSLTNHTSGVIDNPAIYYNAYKFYKTARPYSKDALSTLASLGFGDKIKDTSMAGFFYNYLSINGKYYSRDNFSKSKVGEAYLYSNIGSALAAYLIEVKSGMSYAAFTSKFILRPLKMNHSGWVIDTQHIQQNGKLYFNHTLELPLYTFLTYPDGGLRTTPADLSKYIMAIIRGYYGDTSLLSAASFKQLFTPVFSLTNPPVNIHIQTRNKGVFWNLYSNGIISQDGDDPGISAYLFFNRATGTGGLFMCNEFLPDKQPIIDLLTEAAGKE